MATIIDKDGLSDWADLFPELINTLKLWPDWDHILVDAEYTIESETYLFTAFCLDAAETVCVCVPNYEQGHVSGSVLFGNISDNVITAAESVSVYTIDSIHVIMNNTTLYVGLIDSDITMVPDGIYVGTALSQDGTKQLTPIAGWFKYNRNDVTDKASSNYGVCTAGQINPVTKQYTVQPSSAYNVFLPLVGSSAGVATGIFYRLMSEDEIYNINTISMNGKTFYISGNAVLIDYFEG